MRFDKLAVQFYASVQVSCIQQWLKRRSEQGLGPGPLSPALTHLAREQPAWLLKTMMILAASNVSSQVRAVRSEPVVFHFE